MLVVVQPIVKASFFIFEKLNFVHSVVCSYHRKTERINILLFLLWLDCRYETHIRIQVYSWCCLRINKEVSSDFYIKCLAAVFECWKLILFYMNQTYVEKLETYGQLKLFSQIRIAKATWSKMNLMDLFFFVKKKVFTWRFTELLKHMCAWNFGSVAEDVFSRVNLTISNLGNAACIYHCYWE